MGTILFIIALTIRRIIEPFVYVYNGIFALIRGEWNQYNEDLAVSIDQYGNGLCRHLFNQTLLTKISVHKFGNIDETISSVIGKNKVAGTLTKAGKVVDLMLDLLDPDHSIKSIDNSEK